MAGYRGHNSASARPNEYGEPNYGTHYLDLLTDVLNPLGYAGTELLSEPIGAVTNLAKGTRITKKDPVTGEPYLSDEKYGSKRFGQQMGRYGKTLGRDLGASIRGIGRATQDSFIP
jgi:hypothetical protein